MNFAKFFALSLLLMSPLALARVHYQVTTQANGFSDETNQATSTELQLDANTSGQIYSNDEIQINVELVEEGEENALMRLTIFAKNENGEFEKISEPTITHAYDQDGILELGATDGKSLVIASRVNRI